MYNSLQHVPSWEKMSPKEDIPSSEVTTKAMTSWGSPGRRYDLERRWAEHSMFWRGKTMALPLLNSYGCNLSLHHPPLSQIPPFLYIALHFPTKHQLGLLTWTQRGAAAGKARCTPLPSSGSQQHFSFSKMILASPNHKQLFLLFLLKKKKKSFSSCPFFFFGIKYSWQALFFNCLLLPQPTAMHFIPNSAFYFQSSEQWDEKLALKMCSEESGCHMCVEIFVASPLNSETGLVGAAGISRGPRT